MHIKIENHIKHFKKFYICIPHVLKKIHITQFVIILKRIITNDQKINQRKQHLELKLTNSCFLKTKGLIQIRIVIMPV